MSILHYSRLSFAHVVPRISYPMATLPYVYCSYSLHPIYWYIMSHTHSTNAEYAPCQICPMPNMPHVYYAQPVMPHTKKPSLSTSSDAHYRPTLYSMCSIRAIPHAIYLPCSLYSIVILLYANYALCPLTPMPIISHARYFPRPLCSIPNNLCAK